MDRWGPSVLQGAVPGEGVGRGCRPREASLGEHSPWAGRRSDPGRHLHPQRLPGDLPDAAVGVGAGWCWPASRPGPCLGPGTSSSTSAPTRRCTNTTSGTAFPQIMPVAAPGADTIPLGVIAGVPRHHPLAAGNRQSGQGLPHPPGRGHVDSPSAISVLSRLRRAPSPNPDHPGERRAGAPAPRCIGLPR